MKKTIIFLRGVSGSGKTTVANLLSFGVGPVFTADDYFMDEEGNYNFDVTKLGKAHSACKKGVFSACAAGERTIFVANTSTSEKDITAYRNIATIHGYDFVSLIVENRHGNTDVHNVPEDTLVRQESQLRNSIKLR